MNKFFAKSVFLVLPLLFAFTSLIAQTITVGSVDPGPYGSGSTIAVPFTVNDASGCINTNNVYSLYLCDASGNPIPGAPVDTIQNFYGTAFNFKVPAGTAAGTYTFLIKSSSPAVASTISNTFTISAATGITAAATCPSTEIGNATYPDTYGTCSGSNGMQYIFTNASSSGSTTTATFYNESTQTVEAGNVGLNPSYTFTANAATYLVTVRSVSASGVVSTYSYQLINNVVNTNFGTVGGAQACLVNGAAQLTYTVDYTSATGIQNNFPGNLYTISWGDGTPNGVYTFCQIRALNGLITHTYTKTSCGYTAGTNTDAFPVNYYTTNQYCGKIGTVVSDDAQIYNVPINAFTGPAVACTGTAVSFINTSIPQPCNNASSARYNWSVDGTIVGAGYPLNKNFVTTLTEGSHIISLHLVNPISGTGCQPTDFTQTICVQNPPQPSFTIAQKNICIGNGPVTPINTSIVDTTCNNSLTYTWSVTPSTGVTFNATSAQPNFTFTSSGIYKISLSITTASCGTVKAPIIDTIVVDATAVAKLSPDFSICGTNQTLKFDSLTTSKTYTILTGTTQPQANTYAWTVTGGAYNYAPGYSSSSKYPHIIFTDYATYTITVTQQNICGLVTSTPQHITFQQSPTVIAGNDTSICAGTSANLRGKITGTGIINYKWIGGAGTYTPSADSLSTTYKPSAAEITVGHVTLSLQATTSNASPCNLITSSVIITITPIGTVTSALTKTLCSNQRLNYQITSNNAGSTFTWTAQLISGSATGFGASGTTSIIVDSLINTDPTATTNAVIAYTITPISSNGCPGTPATLNVTVTPLPILTATATNAITCSNQPANINLTTKLGGTKYTWTSTAPTGVSGNTNQSTTVSTTTIKDILINNGTSPANVTYTIIPYSAGGCQGSSVTAVVTVDPVPVTAVAGKDTALCGASSYTLNGNSPEFGNGKWTVSSGSGVTFSNDTTANPTVSGLIPGNIYQFKWTITTGSGCQSQSVVTITDNKQTVSGVTAATGATTVCANANSGQINLTGQVGKVVMWQQSVDNGATWQAVAPLDTLTTLLYKNLTETTQYKAIVQNNVCSILASTVTTITVNQPAPTANAGKDTTLCAATTYNLQGNSPGANSGVWHQISGPVVTFSDSTNYSTTVSNLQGGSIYMFSWTIKGASPCANSQAEVTITDNVQTVPGVTAATGPTTVCANNNSGQINLTGQVGKIIMWQQSVDNGATWQAVAPLDTLTILLYKNLTQTTQYKAIVQNNPCSTSASTITTITVNQPAPTANAGKDTTLCAATTYKLQGNSPGANSGVWHLISGPVVTFSDSTNYSTTVSNLQGGNVYMFSWTIKGASPCANSQAEVTITDNAQTVPGVTAATGPTTVCATSNSGQINLTGQVGKIVMWQQSVNDGATWQTVTPLDTLTILLYKNLTQTTQYKAIVQNNPCNTSASTITTITVSQPAPIANAGRDTSLCGATTYTLMGNSPGSNAGVWHQTSGSPVTFADTSNYQTTISNLIGGNAYSFSWTIIGATACASSQAQVTIIDKADVIASFKGSTINSCGSQTVTFTNTSNNQSGSSFLWNFGDGTTSISASPQHFFKETTNGTDTTYIVSLSVLSNCNQRPPVYDTIHITSDKVIAAILPLQTTGCAPFTLDVQNVSPGNNVSYKFYLYNGNTLVQEIDKTDKTDAIFTSLNVNTPTQYTVYMTAFGPCGTSATTNNIPIVISPPTVTPQMYILNNVSSGCAPLNVSFVNNSSGGSSYHYNIYDVNGNLIEQPIAGTANLPYIFTIAGSYSVSITAANNCSPQGIESAKIAITVYPVPQPAFTTDVNCAATISFLNTTTQNGTTPPGSLSYTWNFGDGSTPEYSFTPKPHYYNFKKSPFTVTLTATNTVTGCADSTVQTINVNAPLIAQFTEQPDSVVTIPNYEFSFIDQSTGPPSSWAWDFGDGTSSTGRNPSHRYADTGYYQVKLIISNNGSCTSEVTHIVRVTGTPGQLFLPNAFMPTGSAYDLRLFMAKGSGIKTWELQIFNNYGQLLWETNKLDSKGSPVEGWDGMFRGVLMQQGAYIWQASATFINGSVWNGMSYNNSLPKRTGTVNLIR
ncbi:PKD domain-containing protein [Mucilaginibacter sp. L196]|uniref:PKD domain-containing protein n=1 Tax=Mucilaginibacter sp. L196 TaxID=1641870 RepID=UPI00131EC888|nr:PKD domain-containing protein [Mucilaginibacter sp. L196]